MVFVAVLAASLCAAGSLRAAAGDMLWEQQFDFPGCDTVWVSAVAASNTTLIICGTAFDSTKDVGDIGFIKAFDQATGNPKWSLDPPLTAGQNRNSFNSMSVVGNTVVAEGYSSTYDSNNNYQLNQTTLRAYKADTGVLLWGPVDKNGAPTNVGPVNMVAANNKVFVVRQEKPHTYDGYITGKCIVQAYQVGTTNAPANSLLLE